MVDRDVFDRRLGHLEELLRRLRGIAEVERANYLADAGIQAQAERWLHLAAECALDLANHLIAERGWQTPKTYREAFSTLVTQAVLDPQLGAAMEGWAGLRNVLVHLYLEVDQEILHGILTGDLDELEAFARALVVAGAAG